MCTSADGRGLAHHGLLHPPSADLAEIVTPLVAQQLASGRPVLAVLPALTAAAIHRRLSTVTGLHTADADELYRHPGRVLAYYAAWITKTSPDEPVTIIAAPNPGNDDPYRAACWMHIDALTNHALATCNLTLICAYPDDPATAAAIRQAHPSLLNGQVTPSPDHLPATRFLARYPLPPPDQMGPPRISRILHRASQLPALRHVLRLHLTDAGLPDDCCDDFLLAITEIASNAVEHGLPPASVGLWITSTSVTCQITDNGQFTKPLAGLLPPPTDQCRGRGLWIAHQLCDQVYLWPDPTTIRLHLDQPAATSFRPQHIRS